MHCIRVHTKGLSHTSLILLIRKVYWKGRNSFAEHNAFKIFGDELGLICMPWEICRSVFSTYLTGEFALTFCFNPHCLLQNVFKCFSIPLRLILLKFWSHSKIKKKKKKKTLNIITLGRVPWISVSYSPNVSLGKVKSISFPGLIEQTMQYH